MKLGDLKPAAGSTKRKKRIGRGNASGWGRNAGRGEKGYGSRTGSKSAGLFEGGQMPLHRRLPKRGFTNHFRKEYEILNLRDLGRVEAKVIDAAALLEAGLINKVDSLIKVLGDGEIDRAVEITVDAFSKSAEEKITAAGGKVARR
ncbi:MAG: 50S ribosomal protein L15 [Candidatus Marinimicrobia bacterium]|jgi:large subunit ribosomal protein L15|nr:50S ribosomal protein L15 [Candidatus Neomarinimicrobiota bacterium]MBT3679115.1 50S ribosomal protein L15 [Candidatus Neomarinimicrobiota bacterium]MBT3951753.1 50S ribosomal protein L15 [Candidatus Neomarinimicrobiota bacterium]MBT4253111.1 50S ribosomal protein L15 [Candidatus Neomarinimicrobiota bacterium]MBT5235047.1 50S ribosomal protein L15 [Candidatus Neomarinimicrobiota bacterium]